MSTERRELADTDDALDPSPTEIREQVEREVEEVRREVQDDEAALAEHARHAGDDEVLPPTDEAER